MKIHLSKPIPEWGRIPTADEIRQLRNLASNIQPTRSGAWKVCWNINTDGTKEPCISYFDKRTRSGEGWTFEAVQPAPKPTKTKPTPVKAIPFICIPDDGKDPAVWFW